MCQREWDIYIKTGAEVQKRTEELNNLPKGMPSFSASGEEAQRVVEPPQRQKALDALEKALWAQIMAYGAYIAAGGSRDTPPTD